MGVWGGPLLSVQFPVTTQNGYVAGGGHAIWKTTDGGTNWSSTRMREYGSFYSVCFPTDNLTGYVAGCFDTAKMTTSMVGKTTDGGANWIELLSARGFTLHLRGVHFPVDGQTGYAVGEFGCIIKTTDGGVTWERQTCGNLTSVLNKVHFPVDAQIGYVVGDGGVILKTTDGGSGVGEQRTEVRSQKIGNRVTARPNPFVAYATIPGHVAERFALYDIAGQRVGTYKGDRIGMDLRPGVYFIRALDRKAGLARIVKLR